MFDPKEDTSLGATAKSGDGSFAGDNDKNKKNELDSDENEALHSLLMSYYRQELDRQAENRYQMAIDDDYYDNIQYSEEDAQVLVDRGQAPIVYNVAKIAIDWVLGTEKRGRTDFKILPRGKEDLKAAEKKTNLMKYLSDSNRLPFQCSRAFEDAVKVGIGWLEDGVQDDEDGEPIYSRYESWRNMLADSCATEMDYSDGRYEFRSKFVDIDVAKAYFPDRKGAIDEGKDSSSRFGAGGDIDGDEAMDISESRMTEFGFGGLDNINQRERVRLIECWFKKPETVKKLTKGTYKGEIYDIDDERHQDGEPQDRVVMRMYLAIMTTEAVLFLGPSPYRHNRFPFTPVWGFKRGRDGQPYGIMRGIRDIQDSVNKMASKFKHILSTNKVIMDEGAVEDIDKFAEEVSRPDAIIVKRQGKELTLNADRDLAPAFMDMFSRDISMIQQGSGVTDENLGRRTNATSGVAIEARQDQGSVVTIKLFDNLRLAKQMQGEIQLSLLEQFMTEKKQFRITNQRGNADFVDINDGMPENDITRSKADFVISESDWRASMRQAATDQLLEVLGKIGPDMAIAVLDLVVDAMDVPNRDEIVKRIRKMNGMSDPDQTEKTPEEMQEEQAEQQAAAKQAAAQEAMFQADLAIKQSQVDKNKTASLRDGMTADLIQAQTITERVVATQDALMAAQGILAMPTIAKVGDSLLAQAGWPDFLPPEVQQGQMPPPPISEQQGLEPQPAPPQQVENPPVQQEQPLPQDGTIPNQPV